MNKINLICYRRLTSKEKNIKPVKDSLPFLLPNLLNHALIKSYINRVTLLKYKSERCLGIKMRLLAQALII